MNNLYRKVAVVSVSLALGFALEANKEAKAATFSLGSNNDDNFFIVDTDNDELGNYVYLSSPSPVALFKYLIWGDRRAEIIKGAEVRSFYRFNFANFSLPSNTVITSAILQTAIYSIEQDPNFNGDRYEDDFRLHTHGIVGYTPRDPLFYNAGEYLDGENFGFILNREPKGIATFNVLPFINQRIKNNDSFFTFGIRFFDPDSSYSESNRDLGSSISINNTVLTITTEPVPEPTTIFGSALALSLGRWLKRKKSSQPNKTTP